MLRACTLRGYPGVSCYNGTMVSHEEVKLLLDVQRTGFNDIVARLMTKFNEKMSKIERKVFDLRGENLFAALSQRTTKKQIEELINKLEQIQLFV